MTNPVAQKKQLPAFLVLTIISLIAAIVLAATNAVTKGPIAEHAARARREAFGAVLQAHDYQELEIPAGHDAVSSLYKAVDADGNELGYTVVATFQGYQSPVAVTLGVGLDGKVTGAVIGDNSFAETAGLGTRWQTETERLEQFKQIDTEEGGSIEAISGVTVTSNAVLKATNAAINCVNEVRGISARNVVKQGVPKAPEVPTVELTGGIHEGNAAGYADAPVYVQLTMDGAGVVTGLAIDSSTQTPGFGTRAMTEPAFAEQFVGKTAPFTLGGNIEALSGATVTSQAVVDAVNMACAAPENPDAVPFGQGAEEEPAEDPAVEASAEPVPADALTASALGFNDYGQGGDVSVTVTLNEDGTIATLDVDVSTQTPTIGDRCADEAWLAQFIGKKGPFVAGENVDIVTGATFTSNGIINALNTLFPAEEVAETPAEETVEAPAEGTADAPAADALTASALGFNDYGQGGDVSVTVTLNEDGTIATLDVDVSTQTPTIGDRCADEAWLAQFIGKKGPFVAGENVDIVTGATFTSNGIINALNTLFPTEEIAETPAEEAPETPAADDAAAIPTDDMSVTGEEGPAAPVVVTLPAYEDKDITVTVTFAADGTVETLAVDASTQSPGLGKKCAEENFVEQFIGGSAPFVLGEGIDAVSYATVTSQAVVDAVNQAAQDGE